MKKLVCLLIAATALLLCACAPGQDGPAVPLPSETAVTQIAEAPTAAPTEAVEETDAPKPTEAPEPTEAPLPTQDPDGDFFEIIPESSVINADMDGDGETDTVEFKHNVYNKSMVKITLAARSWDPFVFTKDYSMDPFAAIADFDPFDDGRMEIVFGDTDSEFGVSYLSVFRLNADGSGFDRIEINGALPLRGARSVASPDFKFFSSEGLPLNVSTEIFGSRTLNAAFTLSEDGYGLCGDTFEYVRYGAYDEELTLLKDLEVSLLDEDLEPAGSTVVPAGSVIIPLYTDNETFAILELNDGSLVRVEVSVQYDPWFCVFVNGVPQSEYVFTVTAG